MTTMTAVEGTASTVFDGGVNADPDGAGALAAMDLYPFLPHSG